MTDSKQPREKSKRPTKRNRNRRHNEEQSVDDDRETQPMSRSDAAKLAAAFIVPLVLLMLYGIYGG